MPRKKKTKKKRRTWVKRVRRSQWTDWHWQIAHTVRDLRTFENLLGLALPLKKRSRIEKTIKRFPMSVTPYYLSLIDPNNFENDPIMKQAFPSPMELNKIHYEMSDPLAEDKDSPAPGLTHRYPDRVLFLVSNTCAMYCRHCTRKRKVGDVDFIPDRAILEKGLAYIRKTTAVRDVLLSGGDPLLLSDSYLDWLLSELRKIPHVEIIRIGSRIPVVLPYRVTQKLISTLKRHQPIWINTHFNHPRELTKSARDALRKLADGGFPLGNQTVLLAGVNDCPRIIKALNHRLVHNRVRPYYLYQCDLSEGLSHFRTPVGKGMEIMESLIGHTSGLAIPTYVIDAPDGGGKIPVMPQYMISRSTNKVILRNYEGMITTYREPDHYKNDNCDPHCKTCQIQSNWEEADEYKAVGIEALLSDQEPTQSLTPTKSLRLQRRRR